MTAADIDDVITRKRIRVSLKTVSAWTTCADGVLTGTSGWPGWIIDRAHLDHYSLYVTLTAFQFSVTRLEILNTAHFRKKMAGCEVMAGTILQFSPSRQINNRRTNKIYEFVERSDHHCVHLLYFSKYGSLLKSKFWTGLSILTLVVARRSDSFQGGICHLIRTWRAGWRAGGQIRFWSQLSNWKTVRDRPYVSISS